VAGEWVQGLSAGDGVMRKIAYFPADTMMHTLHPFTKFFFLLSISVLVFFIESPYLMLFFFGLLFGAFLSICRNPFRYFGMRTTFLTALAIAVIQCLFSKQGKEIANLFGLSITAIGLQRAILISLRFLIIILGSYLFILTTSPSDFTFAFMQLGVPYRYAFMIVTAMRLVPIFSIEGERINFAQRLRGAQYDVRKPRELFFHMSAFLGAILYSLVDRVNKLAVSMEGRSFGRYSIRTYQKRLSFTFRDGILLGSLGLAILLFSYLNWRGIL
jgi:energy-coupling factor transport system permease protein